MANIITAIMLIIIFGGMAYMMFSIARLQLGGG